MTVYPVAYSIRSDLSLVRRKDYDFTLKHDFDGYYQMFKSNDNFFNQRDFKVVHCLRNSTFYLFFVFDHLGNLHLFNSRSEVKRFLRSDLCEL